MDQSTMDWYSKITQGSQMPARYEGPEEQAKCIKKCSILKEIEIGYSNVTLFVSEDAETRDKDSQ